MEKNVKFITNFIFLEIKPKRKGLIVVPGTYRLQIINKALKVYKTGVANNIITTGGVKKTSQQHCESEFQRQYLIKKGVPNNIIFAENKSTNTKENAIHAYKLSKKLGLNIEHIILISKAHHARRIHMTFTNVFVKSNISVVTTIDERNIARDTWFKNKNKTNKVFEEIEKIGKYFLKGDLSI